MHAQVIVVAGPSGAGKSRLSQRIGLPVLRLDDFYKDGSDPSLPRLGSGPNAGLVDWDDPRSWLRDDALKALRLLCETGAADVPVYDIAADGRTGSTRLTLGDARLFVAEGIFAAEVVEACREEGLLAGAFCVAQRPVVTFWRRLARDLRERRKAPSVLVRRGFALMRTQRQIVADMAAKGCTVVTPHEGYAAVRRLLATTAEPRLPWGPTLRQPDDVSCGATSVVVAHMLREPAYARATLPHYDRTVLAMHRSFTRWLSPTGWPQRPWPRRLGTAYWSVIPHLRRLEGTDYVLRDAWFGPGKAFDRLHRAASAGNLAVLYVGTFWLPRHVTLVTGVDGDDLVVFNPASGFRYTVPRRDFVERRLDRSLGHWRRPWTIVVPRQEVRAPRTRPGSGG
ncbi:MAG: hypothetical protein J2O46_04690 [Nocardioides sp.]|nr:hypothetical protein [Nocardioides sp.]